MTMARICRVALLHAYSRRNAGDGLLVDLSVRMIREALGQHCQITLVASDPASFGDMDHVLPAPVIARQGWHRVWACGLALVAIPTAETRRLARVLDSADVIVGVGGGYLRARNTWQALKLQAGHLVQLRAAVASGRPAIYLPQSIGPVVAGPGGASSSLGDGLARQLGTLARVYVRDHRSLAWLDGRANVRRAPDLAVLELGHRLGGAVASAEAAQSRQHPVRNVCMVLREAPAWHPDRREHYRLMLHRLIERLRGECRVSFAVQSAVRGNDDTAFYRALGLTPHGLLRDVLRDDRPDAVVSVRLHGALESVLAGVPAYHLSYERKGFGAYEDLGLTDWVSNAADFQASDVLDTVLAPGAVVSFHAGLQARAATLRAQRQEIVATLRGTWPYGPASPMDVRCC
ncbi:polysaccharide pyruvyl transferase family protein [Cupriavidus sp. H18C2]|uniref:polysaccharide pyruvyl transferase family protein n=2 Tax=Pseudomonadota TaxID=1224 RepID=UPI003BF8CA54